MNNNFIIKIKVISENPFINLKNTFYIQVKKITSTYIAYPNFNKNNL